MPRNMGDDLEKLANAFYKNLEITPWEFGGIGLDPKRPFGNGDVPEDMLDILGGFKKVKIDDEMVYREKDCEYVTKLYREKLIPYLQLQWKQRRLDAKTSLSDVMSLHNKAGKQYVLLKNYLEDIYDALRGPATNLINILQLFHRKWLEDIKEIDDD